MAASRYLRLHTNYDKEASIRKTSVSLPVKLSCVTAWLEQPCLLLVFSGKEVRFCVYLTVKMTVDIPSNWKRMGFFKANFLKALGIKGVSYY